MRLFLLELNEFNIELLESAAQRFNLKYIQKILSLHRTQTFTEDSYESNLLEPWVQWVSIHTGLASHQHQIKHLGDVPDLQTKQLWERLEEKGITSGIWGAMNASRKESCLFFFPDPWTASEQAFPESLNHLLNPLRYVSKNYIDRSYGKIASQLKNLLKLFIQNGLLWKLAKELPLFLKNIVRFRGQHFVFISFIEYLAALLFVQYRERFHPDFSLLFLNSIAHLQHHHWNSKEPLRIGFHYLDRILGSIFSSLNSEEVLMIANALSQKNTREENPWILYRQINPTQFLKRVGIEVCRVEALMTHDAHLFFCDETASQQAKKALEEATIGNQKLFFVESYPHDPKKLFYRILFTDDVAPDATFQIQGKSFRFLDLFVPIVQRTGKHIPQGNVLSSEPLPASIANHELFDWIIKIATAKNH